jgi:CRISPR-associated protein Csx16
MRTDSPHIFLVTRHPGAQDWLQQRVRGAAVTVLPHLADTAAICPGDTVCGVLPLSLAATLCARGATVVCIDIDMPPHLRGHELDAATLDQLGARLVRYRVQASAWVAGASA